MKRNRILVLVALAILWMVPTKITVNAKTTTKQLEVDAELTEWILDEEENMLYAISKSGKSVLFINATTMELEKKLRLPAGPTDFTLDDGLLYIALNSIYQIAVVDVKARVCTDTLVTSADPYSIVKDGNYIFYADYDQWCSVYQYDLETKKDKSMGSSVYQPDLAVDTNRHILYVGESGSSGSDMMYYSTIDGKKISETTYDNGYGFGYPSRKVVTDDRYVYYAARNFNPENASRFDGDYGKSNTILHAENGLVYTKSNIYDRESHSCLGSYARGISLAEMTDTAVYLYSTLDDNIIRYEDEGSTVTSDTVIGLISGKPQTKLPEKVESDKQLQSYQSLEMKYELSDWVLDETNNTVYAISAVEKALLFINATTLDLEEVIHLKSAPKHLYERGGLLYLSIQDAGQILVVNGKERKLQETIYVSKEPVSCVADDKKIYYATKRAVYAYDLDTKNEQLILNASDVGLAINEADGVLYIAEGYSSAKMYYYSTATNAQIGTTASFRYPSKKIFFDGTKVYFAARAFDKMDPKRIYGIYEEEDEEDILLVKNGLVYTESYIYDADSYEYIDYSGAEYYTLFEVFESGRLLCYSKEDQLIERVDEENLTFIMMDPDNGEEMELFYTDKGNLLTEPKEPVRANYEFLGWYGYNEETYELTKRWDFAKDIVQEDIYLVAKWKKVLSPPSNVKASIGQWDASIRITWNSVKLASGYEVYRLEGNEGEYTLIGQCGKNVCEFTDKKVKAGITYRYIVKATAMEDKEKITSVASEAVEGMLDLEIPYISWSEQVSSNTISLGWSCLEGVDGYQIYRSSTIGGSYTFIGETTKDTYTDSNLQVRREYYYKIRAYKKQGQQIVYSEFSSPMFAMPEFESVGIQSKSVSGKTITFSWGKLAGASGYEVYRTDHYFGNYTLVNTTSACSYRDETGEDGVTYYYKVRAYQVQGNKKEYSEYSESIQAATANGSMTTIKAVANGDGTIKVSWTKAAKMTEYQVYRSTSKSGPYTLWAETKKLSYTDKSAKPGITYYYKVVGTRMVGDNRVITRDSNKVNAKAVLSVPGKFKVTSTRKGKAYISWGTVKNAHGFELYESTSKNGKYKKIVTMDLVKERHYTQSYLKSGKTYYYKIRAYRKNGNKKVYSNYTKAVSIKVK